MSSVSSDKALPSASRFWHPYVAGTLLGMVLFLTFAFTGHGLGASGGLTRLIAAAQGQLAPEHVRLNPELANAAGGPGHPLNHWLVWMIAGVLLGGLTSGAAARRLKPETFTGPRLNPYWRWGTALLGGLLVGFGARLARGCTSGQALSGGAVLSLGSWAFMFAVFAGGYLVAYLVRRFWN